MKYPLFWLYTCPLRARNHTLAVRRSLYYCRSVRGADRHSTDAADKATTGSWSSPEIENASSASCGGAAILLSDDFLYAATGSGITIDCRAVGTTGIYWVLPGHKVNRKAGRIE